MLLVGRLTLHLAAAAVTVLSLPGIAAAQTYPSRPVRIVVPFPPGSTPDTVARLLGERLAEAWEKPVVIDNAAGAAGNIAAERVAKAAPDGYTLGLLSQPQLAVNPSLYKLTYHPVNDFEPVSLVAASTFLLVVHAAVPAKGVRELVALAKAHPGELTFASAGSGSTPHIAAELFKSMAGLDMRHVPYKGVGAAIPDLLGGRVTMTFSPSVVVLSLVQDGKLRALAMTSLRRSTAFPEVPTIAESGYPGFEARSWNGLLAPARTPGPIVRKINVEAVKALALPDLRARLAGLGLEGIGSSPAEFGAHVRSETLKWAKVIRASGIKPE